MQAVADVKNANVMPEIGFVRLPQIEFACRKVIAVGEIDVFGEVSFLLERY